ncbi:hypothetical protein GQ600_3100 [Phytophthora cactorum]|nr:hypothetical protein GQ600_3100 [Phytophthora cactorum]
MWCCPTVRSTERLARTVCVEKSSSSVSSTAGHSVSNHYSCWDTLFILRTLNMHENCLLQRCLELVCCPRLQYITIADFLLLKTLGSSGATCSSGCEERSRELSQNEIEGGPWGYRQYMAQEKPNSLLRSLRLLSYRCCQYCYV